MIEAGVAPLLRGSDRRYRPAAGGGRVALEIGQVDRYHGRAFQDGVRESVLIQIIQRLDRIESVGGEASVQRRQLARFGLIAFRPSLLLVERQGLGCLHFPQLRVFVEQSLER